MHHTIYTIFFLSFLLPATLLAQKLDSISLQKMKIEAETYDSIGYEAVMTLGGYYYRRDDKKMLRYYLLKEVEHAKHSGEKKKIADAYYHNILYHQAFSGRDSVFEVGQVLLNYLDKDTSSLAKRYRIKVYTQIGVNFYYDYDDVEKAYSYYKLAQEEAFLLKDKNQYAEATRELSIIHKIQGRNEKAVAIIDSALINLASFPNGTLSERLSVLLPYERAAALIDMENSNVDKEETYQVYKNRLYYERNREALKGTVITITEILETFEDYLPLDSLLAYSKEGVEIDAQLREQNPNLYKHYARNLMRANKYQEAEQNLQKALELALKKAEWYVSTAEIYDMLTEIHIKRGHSLKAENTFTQYKLYRDSVLLDERNDAIETITANYELEKKNAENIILRKQSETLSLRNRLLSIIGILLVSFLGLGAYFFLKMRMQSQKMEKLNETKNKIFTILAHDLKGPSLIFNNLAKKLNFLISKNDNNRLLEMAEYYEESGRKVSRIINGVLDWAIAEKDSFINNPEKIEISPILKNMIDDFKFELEQKNIKIDFDVTSDANIVFDKNAFQIINRNLMHNAIKFSPLDSTINIKFDKKIQSLEYIDYGKGFDSATASKVLQMMPVESSEGTINEKGTGIGLVTCVKLLKENKGVMEIEKLTPVGTKIQLLFKKDNN